MLKLEILQSLLLEQPQKIVIVPDEKHIKIGEFDRLNTKSNSEKEKSKRIIKDDSNEFSKYLDEEIKKYR